MYEKQTWNTGDVITEEKLNHMEDGIASGCSGGGVMIVNVNHDRDTGNDILDKTWKEIHDAYISGTTVIIKKEGSGVMPDNRLNLVLSVRNAVNLESASYDVLVMNENANPPFTVYDTDSETGYPKTANL